MTVAALKRIERLPTSGLANPFHGHMTVAALKRLAGGRLESRNTSFHGHMTVAALKRHNCLRSHPGHGCFPRSHDRGRIEASHAP